MKKSVIVACSALLLAMSASAEVKIGGKNEQSVDVKNGAVVNMANGNLAEANQNLASNKGKVNIGGNNSQQVNVENGAVVNMANGSLTKAEQNLASNDGK